MIVEQKILAGVMNTDDSNENIAANQHKLAYNIRFRGPNGNLRPENIPGTVRINNGSLPAGSNKNNVGFYDPKRRRIIWWNWNENGNSGIYSLSTETGLITQIFRCGVQSATDILNLDLNYPVHSFGLVYRDAEGDLLSWTDGNERPKCLNIGTVEALRPFTANMLNLAKDAPLVPAAPQSFGNGTAGDSNYLLNKLFRFAYRWVFKNGEKSSISPISKVLTPDVIDPVPLGQNPHINNSVLFHVYAPDLNDFKAIELFVQEAKGTNNLWNDFQQLDVLDRDQYGIGLGATVAYRFFNNGIYPVADILPDDMYFYYVPDKANTMELLNGNSFVFGGTTEGGTTLQRNEVNVQITASLFSTGASYVSAAFRYATPQRFGLVYFDERGKTNGVVSFVGNPVDSTDFAVDTPEYATTTSPSNVAKFPKISASINHLPPAGAVSYQWVRANLTPKFRHYVTNDYQTDTQYMYLGIENFIQMAAQNSFVSPYDFSSGDRVKIMAKNTGDDVATAYSTQYDLQILEVVERTMSNQSILGKFLKIQKPSVIPTPAYTSGMFIDIYTPILKVDEKDLIFFEWGQRYAITGGYHMGQTQNQTGSQPALFEWTDGDVWLKRRAFFLAVPIQGNTTPTYLYMQDANWTDYVATAANSNGRGWAIDFNAKQTYNPAQVRWGEAIEQDTDINKLNVFYPLNFDVIDRSKGDILRMMVEKRLLYVYQYNGVGQMGVYTKFIQDNSGTTVLTTTNQIITTNNVNYLKGNFGLGTQPCSLTRGKGGVHYFIDVTTGTMCRRSEDGITPLTDLYKGRYYISDLLSRYNKSYVKDGTGVKSRIIGGYSNLEEDYLCAGEFGRYLGIPINPFCLSFNKERNGFGTFYGKPENNDFEPEWIVGAEDIVYFWKNGEIYKQDSANANENEYTNLLGIEYPSSIKLVFNKQNNIKKNFDDLQYQSNRVWSAPTVGDINTSVINPNTDIAQRSLLIEQDFEITDNVRYAAFLRDMSGGGFLEDEPGDYLNGNWIEVNFVYRGNKPAWLFLPTVVGQINNRNY